MKFKSYLITVTVLTATALLFVVLGACAAPLPPLPVSRPKPALSPKHSVKSKDMPMFRVASEPQRLPMTVKFEVANSEFGTFYFEPKGFKPAGAGIKFEVAKEPNGDWIYLSEFGASQYDEWSFVGFYSYTDKLFVRAYLTSAATRSVIGRYDVNPEFKKEGAKAWTVRK